MTLLITIKSIVFFIALWGSALHMNDNVVYLKTGKGVSSGNGGSVAIAFWSILYALSHLS
jgi:hypothetical protein